MLGWFVSRVGVWFRMTERPKPFLYRPDGKVLQRFFHDRDEVSIIQGPVGSGTSTACCHKMFKISLEQKPDRYHVRRSRWLIVRNTYSDLKGTTLKTWRYWFEEIAQGAFGEVKMTNPPHHDIKIKLPDATILDAEFIFLALDQEEDVRKLVSLECTGVFFNEMQFTDKTIFDTAHSRAMQGRYPPKLSGGPTWKGVIGDLNAPPEGHWIPYMRGDVPLPEDWDEDDKKQYVKPEGWNFYVQPPGLLEVVENGKISGYVENNYEERKKRGMEPVDEVAENMNWIDESYLSLIKGKPKTWIDTFVMNRVGLYRAGKPVFESFRREVHVAKEKVEYQPEWPLLVGLDFARNPAAVLGQLIRGTVYILDEFGMENVAAGTYAPALKQRIAKRYAQALGNSAGIQFWGDPTGGSKGQATDQTPFSIFQSNGMVVAPAPGGNKLSVRLEAVQTQLDKQIGGVPGMVISPSCIWLKNGMAGGYHFAKLKGQQRYHEEPTKDRFSDYCDALQYLCLGAGLGFAALHPGQDRPRPMKIKRKRFSLRR